MPDLYAKEVMKHFMHPKNVGKIENADGVGRVGNFVCGDIMELYLKVNKNKITDAKFQTFGCVVAVANTSLLTSAVRGKTLEEALKITKDDMLKKIKHVPPIKVHCSVLAVDALHEAIYDYLTRNKLPVSDNLQTEHQRIQETLDDIGEKH